eukprot:Pgem_evm1s5908
MATKCSEGNERTTCTLKKDDIVPPALRSPKFNIGMQNKLEGEANEFHAYARKNGFGSCSYPTGGYPSNDGCICHDKFSEVQCDEQ